MPLSSRVIKAGQVRINGGVYKFPAAQCAVPLEEAQAETEPVQEMDAFALQQRYEDLRAEAEEYRSGIIAAAAQERESMLRKAELEGESIREQAYKRGYDDGFLQGMGEGQRETVRLQREASELLEEARRIRREMLDRVEPQVVELAIRTAETLIGQQLTLAPETVVSCIAQALRQVSAYGEILVRTHPEDLQLCRVYRGELQAGLRENASLDFIADPTLTRGSCRVETGGTLVECLIDERLSELRKALAAVGNHA